MLTLTDEQLQRLDEFIKKNIPSFWAEPLIRYINDIIEYNKSKTTNNEGLQEPADKASTS